MEDRRRTKIVATVGPATWQPERLAEIVEAGVDVVRVNFSHADYDRFRRVIKLVRELSERHDRSIGVLGDLQGPKIRTGELKGGSPVTLVAGEECVITTLPVEGTAARLSTTYPLLARDVAPGQEILLADGARVLKVIDTTDTDVRCEVLVGGELAEHQGINLPGTQISSPPLTEKDIADLEFCLAERVDYVALSFVRKADDILELRRRIEERGHETPIVAKIEKPEAVENIRSIIEATDAVMVARGDLGVEMAPEVVPLEQKKLIALSNFFGKPVITATQMLESMVHSPRATRAEASDVANAIFDGTDAVMLSAETAVGRYPVEAIETMGRIALAVERASFSESSYGRGVRREWRRHHDLDVSEMTQAAESSVETAAADAAVSAARDLDAAGIVVFTLSGSAAMKIAKRRPQSPIYAMTPHLETYNRLSMVWGVTPMRTAVGRQTDAILTAGEEMLLESGRLHRGDVIVIVSGAMPMRGATNFVKIQRIGE
ncbi:MAG: pyruvate kinase [Planctomycetes bacterium]|nr:pyruvate kinase [Planctomycetota bacterium]